MEFVKINDESIENKQYTNIEDYEKNLTTIVTRGFNIVYGNVYSRQFKYYQFKNEKDGEERTMKEPI